VAVDDQRNVGTRPDVISFVTDPLTEPLKISGQPEVNLVASTSFLTQLSQLSSGERGKSLRMSLR
jgi:predicted acyl esterase